MLLAAGGEPLKYNLCPTKESPESIAAAGAVAVSHPPHDERTRTMTTTYKAHGVQRSTNRQLVKSRMDPGKSPSSKQQSCEHCSSQSNATLTPRIDPSRRYPLYPRPVLQPPQLAVAHSLRVFLLSPSGFFFSSSPLYECRLRDGKPGRVLKVK